MPKYDLNSLFDISSRYYNGALQLNPPPGGVNAFLDGVNPLTIGDPLSGTNISNLGLAVPIITVGPEDSIQAAMDKLNQIGGGRIVLLAGTYVINTALTGYSSITIEGISPSATVLNFNSTSANLSYTGTNVYTTGTITVASTVFITGSGTSWLSNVTAGQHLFLGTRWYEIAAVTSDTTLILTESYGDNVTLPSTYRIASIKQNIIIKNLTLKNSTGTALAITDGRRVTLDNLLLLTNNKGLVLTNVSETNVERVLAAANTSNGIELTNFGLSDWESVLAIGNDGTGLILNNCKQVNFYPCLASGNMGDGWNITTGVNISGTLDAISNGGQGIELVATNDGLSIFNSVIQANTSDGMKLTATTDNVRLYGCNIQFNGGYGVNVADATCDNMVITTNTFVSNTSGAVNDNGTSTIIRGNVGVSDNSSGTVSQFTVLGLGGDGSDGAALFDGSATPAGSSKSGSDYTLTRDVFYTDMTVSTGCTVNPAGYRIFGTGTLTLNGTAVIKRNGNAGTSGSSGIDGSGGGAGGTALADGYLKGSAVGGAGGNAGGNNGANGANTSNSLGSSGQNGGSGGAGSGTGGNGGGSGGTATAMLTSPKTAWQLHLLLDVTSTGATIKFDNSAGGAGGGSGGKGTGNGTGGGGAGSAGGIIAIYFKTIIVGASASITANGGNGGNGGNFGSTNGGGGGGGAGGNGGQIILAYGTYTNSGTVTASGGTKGAGGSKDGTGTAGSAGTDGAAGTIRTFAI